MPVVSATGITPLLPLPPICAILRFHDAGRLTWKLIGGADKSTGAMLPVTLQYSGVARTARSPTTVSGAAAVRIASVIVAPVVGSPIEAAGMASPFSEPHVAWFLTVVCGASARPDAAAIAITTPVVIRLACRMVISSDFPAMSAPIVAGTRATDVACAA